MKGKYYCEIYDGPRRRSLCLHTDDPAIAAERYGDGMKQLRAKIRSEQAPKEVTPAWLPRDAVNLQAQFRSLDQALDGRADAQAIAAQFTGKGQQDPTTGELIDKDTEQLAEVIAGVGVMPLSWYDLMLNARTVHKRKKGQDYSEAWIRNTETTIKRVDFGPLEATPIRIRQWMDMEEANGMSSVTLKNRLSALQGLIERGITSGYRPDLAPNPFKMVDFSISKKLEEKNNYYCPTDEDYRKLFNEVLPQQPERIRVGIELMAWTGTRVSGVPYLRETEERGWLVVPDVDGTKGGGRVPVPMDLWERGRDLKISVRALNKVLKEVHPELCNHGLRSGFKMLSRRAGIDSQLGEDLLMHKLQGLESTYGGEGFPDVAKQRGAQAVWEELQKVIG